MHRFAFILHPLQAKDMARKYPWVKFIPEAAASVILKKKKPAVLSEITGIKSKTGAETSGWFIGCPLTAKQIINQPLDSVYEKIIRCGEIAQELGAEIVGLGAFTSVAGDGGITVAKNLKIKVTTGNSYTVATALDGTIKAAHDLGLSMSDASLAVVGAAGSIGRTCALSLASSVKEITLIGRSEVKLIPLKKEVESQTSSKVFTSINVQEGLKNADIIITVTSAGMPIIEPNYLKPGAIVCDVARPRDVSVKVSKERKDVLVIEGGVVSVPGNVNFDFDFGFPEKTAYACMSETMILALEGKIESFTLGKEVSLEQVEIMRKLAQRHGFEITGFRSFEKAVSQETIDYVKSFIVNRETAKAGL